MAGVVPAHVSVVYPEEVTDESLLLERIDDVAPGIRSFPLDIRGVAGDADASGVFLGVSDRTGALRSLKQRLLCPPFAPSGYPLHVTIVHPRTSSRGPEALAALHAIALSGSVVVSELCWTETSAEHMTVRRRWELPAPRLQQVAAVLRDKTRVLLCHRSPRREYFPDTWDLPGGHVEPGEHAADALVRELREELGIVVPDLPAEPGTVLSDDGFGVDLAVWFIDRWDGEPENTAPEEHDAIEWCTPDQWQHRPLAHPAYLSLLRHQDLHPT